MEISQAVLARLYLLAAILGAGLGVCYDILRITRVFLGVQYSRRATKKLQSIQLPFLNHSKKRTESPLLGTVIFFEDLLFGLFCGIAMILLFYGANNGNFRFPAIITALGGFFLYRATLGKLVMLFSEVIAFFVEALIRYVFFFVFLPFRWIGKKMARLLHKGVRFSHQKVQKEVRKRYTRHESGRMADNACGMIPEQVVQRKRILKRGHSYGAKKAKTVQLEHTDESLSCRHRRGLFGRVCK